MLLEMVTLAEQESRNMWGQLQGFLAALAVTALLLFLIWLCYHFHFFSRQKKRPAKGRSSTKKVPRQAHAVLKAKTAWLEERGGKQGWFVTQHYSAVFLTDEGKSLSLTCDQLDYDTIEEGDEGTIFYRKGVLLGFLFDHKPSAMTYEQLLGL